MNIFASDSSAASSALKLALALPGMLSTWTLAQPGVLGFVSADGKPLAAISDVGTTAPGQPVSLDARASYDPARPGATLSYRWNFGDGAAQAQGATIQHTWATAGDYTLTLTVSDAGGARTIRKRIHVTASPQVIQNPYAPYPQNGIPPANPAVTLPTGGQSPNGGTSGGSSSLTTTPHIVQPVAGPPWALWIALAVAALLALGLIGFGVSRLRRPAPVSGPEDTERRWREDALRNLYAPPSDTNPPPDRVD
jgi:hypothetical protein